MNQAELSGLVGETRLARQAGSRCSSPRSRRRAASGGQWPRARRERWPAANAGPFARWCQIELRLVGLVQCGVFDVRPDAASEFPELPRAHRGESRRRTRPRRGIARASLQAHPRAAEKARKNHKTGRRRTSSTARACGQQGRIEPCAPGCRFKRARGCAGGAGGVLPPSCRTHRTTLRASCVWSPSRRTPGVRKRHLQTSRYEPIRSTGRLHSAAAMIP